MEKHAMFCRGVSMEFEKWRSAGIDSLQKNSNIPLNKRREGIKIEVGEKSPFGVLKTAAGALAAVFFSLLATRISRQKTALA